jgi:hypothetical protein
MKSNSNSPSPKSQSFDTETVAASAEHWLARIARASAPKEDDVPPNAQTTAEIHKDTGMSMTAILKKLRAGLTTGRITSFKLRRLVNGKIRPVPYYMENTDTDDRAAGDS